MAAVPRWIYHRPQGVNCDHVDWVVRETHSVKWISSGLRAPVWDLVMLRALDGFPRVQEGGL